MLLFVCAVARELEWIATPDPRYDVLATGVGPIDAAASVARALTRNTYSLVVNAGIAGAFASRASIGDALVVAQDAFAELGTEDGIRVLRDGSTFTNHARSNEWLVHALARRGHAVGNGVTVARVTAGADRAAQLAREFDASVESMEGFAVLRTCELAGVPAIEVRGVSNIVGPREGATFDFSAGSLALRGLVDDILQVWK